jgi:hypothetical protein
MSDKQYAISKIKIDQLLLIAYCLSPIDFTRAVLAFVVALEKQPGRHTFLFSLT